MEQTVKKSFLKANWQYFVAAAVGGYFAQTLLHNSDDTKACIQHTTRSGFNSVVNDYLNGCKKPLNITVCERSISGDIGGSSGCKSYGVKPGEYFFTETLPDKNAGWLTLSVGTAGFTIDACTAPKIPAQNKGVPSVGTHSINNNLVCN